MTYEITGQLLEVQFQSDFNLLAVQKLEAVVTNMETIHFDMKGAKFADSQAVIFLNSLIRQGKKVRISNPPKIFFEVIRILGLDQAWNIDELVIQQ